MKRNKNDVIAEIKTALDEAKVKARAYKYLTAKRYDYRRALAAIAAYDQALAIFAQGTEHNISDLAIAAIAEFEWARDNDTPKMTLAVADGRRDAFASVADWMTTEEGNR